MEAARALQDKDRLSVTVLDLVWLSPLDDAAIAEAVNATAGPIVIAHEANRTGGFGAEIAARIQELGVFRPVLRVATPDTRIPASPVLQKALIPNADTIASAIRVRTREAA